MLSISACNMQPLSKVRLVRISGRNFLLETYQERLQRRSRNIELGCTVPTVAGDEAMHEPAITS
jgi:hypothetical protein